MRNRWLVAQIATASLVTVTLGGFCPATAEAQDELLLDDIEFARTLARYRYFDLADKILKDLSQEYTGAADRTALSFAKASILKLAGEFSANPDDRRRFYKQAIDGYEAYLASSDPDNPRFNTARIELGEVYSSFGKFIRTEAEGLPESQAQELRTEADGYFKSAITLMNKTYKERYADGEAYRDESQTKKAQNAFREAFLALYQKGVCEYERALAYPPADFNRADHLKNSLETFDEYIFENEETTLITSYAYFYQGVANTELAKIAEQGASASHVDYALVSFKYVLHDQNWGLWSVLEYNPELESGLKGEIAKLAERTTYELAQVEAERGMGDEAIKAVESLESNRDKFDLGEPGPYGSLARLMKAQALFDGGDFDQAIRLAQNVAEKNLGNNVGSAAQKKLSNWIGEGVDIGRIPPDVLYNVAEGRFSDSDFLGAIAEYHRVLASVVQSGDDAKRLEFGPKSWKRIGDCYMQMRRYLEAAIAFETGLTGFPGASEEDLEKTATGYYNSWLRRSRETEDEFDRKEKDKARQKVAAMKVGDLQYWIATDRFTVAASEKDEAKKKKVYDEALVEFDKVESRSLYYERAWVYKARCHFAKGDSRQALKLIDDYFKYVEDPVNAPSSKEQRHREIALADGTYYKAQFQKDLGNYADVLTTLQGFEENNPTMDVYFAQAAFLRIDANVGLHKLEVAEELLSDIRKRFPKDTLSDFSMYRVGKGYIDRFKKATEGEKDASDQEKAFLRRGAELLFAYSDAVGHNSFSNLKLTGDSYFELGDYDLAKRSYDKVIAVFGANERYKDTVEAQVKKNLAISLTRLHKFKEARALWDAFDPATSTSRSIIEGAALCYGGWLEGDSSSNFKEIPGGGQYVTAVKLWGRLLKEYFTGADNPKYSPDWWSVKFMTIYCRYKAGLEDPTHLSQAKKLLNNIKVSRPDLGGTESAKRYRWLDQQLR